MSPSCQYWQGLCKELSWNPSSTREGFCDRYSERGRVIFVDIRSVPKLAVHSLLDD